MQAIDNLLYRATGWRKVGALLALALVIMVILLLGSFILQLVVPYDNWSWDTIKIYSGVGTGHEPISAKEFWIFLVSFIGKIIFSGLVTASIVNIFNTRISKVQMGLIRYKMKQHYVVIGFNDLSVSIIRSLLKTDSPIVLHTGQDVRKVNERLLSLFGPMAAKRIILYSGSRQSDKELLSLNLPDALAVYLVGDNEPTSDAISLITLSLMTPILDAAPRRVVVTAIFKDPATATEFERATPPAPKTTLVYNQYDLYARTVLVSEEQLPSLPAYPKLWANGKGIHLVIIGMSEMGMAFAKTASLIAHYPQGKSRITFIDKRAKERELTFRNRYSHLFDAERDEYRYLGDFMDMDYEFLQADVRDETTRAQLVAWAKEQNLFVAVCLDDEREAREIATYLPIADPSNSLTAQPAVPIYVYQPTNGATQHNIYPFGLLDKGFHIAPSILLKAQQLNHLYNKAYGHDTDSIENEWWSLPMASRLANIHAVYFLPTLRRIRNEQSVRLAEVEHNRWVIEKLLAGYRPLTAEEHKSYQPSQKKTLKARFIHPDLCSFDALKADETGKDIKSLDRLILELL